MSTHKNIDRICIITTVICLIITIVFLNAPALGIGQKVHAMGYESRLFDTDRVHTIDIVMDDWNGFIKTAQSEEYSNCTVVIDGESFRNVGIRGKGNTSLSNVASMDSDRYSFKVEFDQYDSNKSYHGLDKLSLNNVIQDNTYMKDYLTYRLMKEAGVSAPLCSFAYITVNGDDWGLYLAVEGVEDSFMKRNYGNSSGKLYKPDSTGIGGGRGNGKDFNMENFADDESESGNEFPFGGNKNNPNGNMNGAPGEFAPPGIPGGMPQMGSTTEISDKTGISAMENGELNIPQMGDRGMPGGMGSDDIKLKYSDDNYESYSNIFNNAKTDITDDDKDRLIASLKSLSKYENLEDIVDIEKVIRYFVVHNFVCNGDSYTGSMIHNYYLYENNGKLSMIPWDYNLAFGTFQGGNATGQVNSPIDTPVSGDMSERPMIGWIFSDNKYIELYHKYFEEFLSDVDITKIIDSAAELISEYVEKDPTKFCTYEEFEKGVDTLRKFCQLRAESVSRQLNGTIPSTSTEQNSNSATLIDASSTKLSDMGTMNHGGIDKGGMQPPEGFGGEMPSGGMQPPEGFGGQMPDFGNMQIPTDESGNPVIQNPSGNNTDVPDIDSEKSTTDQNTQTGRNPFGQKSERENFSNMKAPQESEKNQSKIPAYILLGLSALMLAGGLIFAFRFKR